MVEKIKAKITKIEECTGGISICVRYHEPESHIEFEKQRRVYTEALNDFDANIKKLHIGDMVELEFGEENEEKNNNY